MATNTKSTVGNILQDVADMRGESSVDTSAFRIRVVSLSEQDFARRMFWRFFLLENQTIAGTGSNDYTIGSTASPYRPKGLTELYVATTGSSDMTPMSGKCDIVDFRAFKTLYNQDNNKRMVYEWYDSANDLWKIHINPAPASTETITYSYFWEPPTRTSTSDPIICPRRSIISLMSAGAIFDSEDEIQKAQLVKNDAEQQISDLMGAENSPAVNQLYAMGAIENVDRPRGIGTY